MHLEETTAAAKKDDSPMSGRWTAEEHERFMVGLAKFGRRKWMRIAEHVGSRTVVQVRSHAQKFFKKTKTHNGFALLAAAADILEAKTTTSPSAASAPKDTSSSSSSSAAAAAAVVSHTNKPALSIVVPPPPPLEESADNKENTYENAYVPPPTKKHSVHFADLPPLKRPHIQVC